MAGVSGGSSNQQSQTNPNNSIGVSEGAGSNWSEGVQNPDTVWGGQAPYLQNMYGNAQRNYNQYNQQGMNTGQGVFDTALEGYNSLMNPGMNPQLEAYQGSVQRNLERNVLPSIQSGAGMAGQMGGSRQGVAQGLALSDANQQVTDMASNLYNEDRNRQLAATQFAPTLGNFGMGIPWYGLNQTSGILGSPTVLGGGGYSSGGGENWSSGYQRDIGGGGTSSGSSWNGQFGIN